VRPLITTTFSIKTGLARLFVLAATLLLVAGPAAPKAIACGGEGESEPLLINGELPGGG
jgi:hypothetical protein